MNPDILFLKDFVDQNFEFEVMSSVWCVRNKHLNVAGIKSKTIPADDLLNIVAGRITRIFYDSGGEFNQFEINEIKELLKGRIVHK